MKKFVLTALAFFAIATLTVNAGVIYSEDFSGTSDGINGIMPDVSQTGESWVAAPVFKQDGSVVPNAGSMTLAYTPQNGAVYTLDGSVRSVTGSSHWFGLGFAKGQSDTSGTNSRFTKDGGENNKVRGQAWMLFRGDLGTLLNKTHYDGTDNPVDWTALTDLTTDVDMRVVLDTTAGDGNWTATWYAKAPADSDYTQVGGATVLPEMIIDSVGFAIANNQVDGTVAGFSLRDNQATVIYPKDGEYVSPAPADVDLQWINDQLEPGDPNAIFVDVWFGTDPNKASSSYTKVVDAGEETTTYLAQNLAAGTYYWQIDYYSGNPAVTMASPIEGQVHSFIVTEDAPIESVDVGPDMMTWDGEPVQLNPNIIDDGISALNYSWTASLPNGLEATFTPDATDANPTVTLTKVPYANAIIANSSFEDPFIPDDATAPGVRGVASGWTSVGGSTNPGVSNIALTGLYGSSSPDGRNMVWVEANQYLSQELTETFQENADYTLTTAVGFDSRWGAEQVTYAVQLLAGSVVIAQEPISIIADPNNYVNVSVNYVYDAADADKIGQNLEIRLIGNDPSVSETGATVLFDNVVLISTPDFPAPTGVHSADITLIVQDAVNPALSDSVTIDVYDTACDMTVNGLGIPITQTDHNADCVTDLRDFVVIAAAWLDAYAETAPVEK